MDRVVKRAAAVMLAIVLAIAAYATYRLVNPVYEKDGIAIIDARLSTREDRDNPELVVLYQNRTGKDNGAFVSFRLYDKDGKEAGIAYGTAGSGGVSPPISNGWIGVARCPMATYKYFLETPEGLTNKEKIEDIASWEISVAFPLY